jgi:probable F420-dependent oxidoreductase
MLRLGAIFPQTEIGNDPAAIRDYAQAVEGMGFAHILAFDHVVGANTERPDRANRRWPYTHLSPFHEPMVLFGFLAAATRQIELTTGVIVLPQRQAILAAKQAAAADVLSGGRLRYGVGLGWNDVEYQALDENFHTRGRRIEEQVALLRALWTQELVTFHGRWHHVEDAGLNPLPVQRPIPLWMGGTAPAAIQRIARLADGWIVTTGGRSAADWAPQVDAWREAAREAGRDPTSVGLDPFLSAAGTPEDWRREAEGWQRLGATHLSINTMRLGLPSSAAHVETLHAVKEALADL